MQTIEQMIDGEMAVRQTDATEDTMSAEWWQLRREATEACIRELQYQLSRIEHDLEQLEATQVERGLVNEDGKLEDEREHAVFMDAVNIAAMRLELAREYVSNLESK